MVAWTGELFPAGCRPYQDELDYYSVHLYPPPNINTTAALKQHFEQQMAELPDDSKPVFVSVPQSSSTVPPAFAATISCAR